MRALVAAWLVAILLIPPIEAFAETPEPAENEESGHPPLRSRSGIVVAERWLGSGSAADRLRALERLGTFGTPRALERLVKALEPGGEAASGPARLTAVRALAPHVERPVVMQALVRVMAGVGGSQTADEVTSLDELARQTAAMVLAGSESPSALRALGKALKSVGPAARAASTALLSHPPRNLDPILSARGRPGIEYVRLLGELGDQRAFAELRTLVRRGTTAIRAEAAWALTKLGDFETVPLALDWLNQRGGESELSLAAGRILSLSRSQASSAVRKVLATADNESGIDLALHAPTREVVPALLEQVQSGDPEQVTRLVAAIGRAGGGDATRWLAREIENGAHAGAAAYVLARMPGSEPRNVLVHALQNPQSRRLAVRAAALRVVLLDDEIGEIRATADTLLSSGNDADRAAGASALATIDPDLLESLLSSRDKAVVRAAARGLAWTSHRGALEAARERLLDECDALTITALSASLARRSVYENVPTRHLLRLSEAGGPQAPLAARALAARYVESIKPRVEALLESSDPWLRAHAALGLGKSRSPAALGLLASTYRFETNSDVRHALVVALSQQADTARLRVLELAADLDPDRSVRSAARLALRGIELREDGIGHSAFWLELRPSTGSRPVPLQHPIIVRVAAGLAVPLVGDPDGVVSAAGLPEGSAGVRVAAATKDDHACERTFGSHPQTRTARD